MHKIEIYSKGWCPFCSKAKSLLQSKQLDYAEIDITTDLAREQEMIDRSGRRTVPQIFIDGDAVGGYDDLANINATGELDQRLDLAPAADLDKIYDVVVVGAGPGNLVMEARKVMEHRRITVKRSRIRYPGTDQLGRIGRRRGIEIGEHLVKGDAIENIVIGTDETSRFQNSAANKTAILHEKWVQAILVSKVRKLGLQRRGNGETNHHHARYAIQTPAAGVR